MSYKANLEQLSISPTGKVASAVQADSATTATTATNAATVADNSITTTKIVNQAVTAAKRQSSTQAITDIGAGFQYAGSQLGETVKSVSISCSGNRPVLIYFEGRDTISLSGFRSDSIRPADSYQVQLLRNGVAIKGSSIWQRSASGNIVIDWILSPGLVWFIDQNPPAGTNTYATTCATSADDGDLFYSAMRLIALEI